MHISQLVYRRDSFTSASIYFASLTNVACEGSVGIGNFAREAAASCQS